MSESEKAYKRYLRVVNLLKSAGDKKGLKLVHELVNKCVNYFDYIVRVQLRIEQVRFRMEGEYYRMELESIDRNRRLLHNALISQLQIVNRYLFRNKDINSGVPVGGVFSGSADALMDRYAVASWAGYLVKGLRKHHVLKEDKILY